MLWCILWSGQIADCSHFNLDMFLSGAVIMDLIPRSCQFPPNVNQFTQVFDIENLQKADKRAGHLNSDSGR